MEVQQNRDATLSWKGIAVLEDSMKALVEGKKRDGSRLGFDELGKAEVVLSGKSGALYTPKLTTSGHYGKLDTHRRL